MKNKIILSGTLFIVLLFSVVSPVFAAGGTPSGDGEITKEYTYTAQTPDEKYLVEGTVIENGKTYQLKDISRTVLDEKDITAKKTATEETKYYDLYDKQVNAPGTYQKAVDGRNLTFNLSGTTYTDTVIKGRTATVSGTTDYGYQTFEPKAPKEKEIPYHDTVTGQTVTGTVPLKELRAVEGWSWRPGLEIPITVEIYNAELYELNGKYVPYNDAKPALEGYEGDVLAVLGLDAAHYRITDMEWSGAAYEQDGVLCRRAVVSGDRYTARYEAAYSGSIPLPDAPGYDAVATYTANYEAPTGEKEYTMKAVVIYAPVVTASLPIVPIATGGGATVIGLFVVFWAFSRNVIFRDVEGKRIGSSRVKSGKIECQKAFRKTKTFEVIIKKSYVKSHTGGQIIFTKSGSPVKQETIPLTKSDFTVTI